MIICFNRECRRVVTVHGRLSEPVNSDTESVTQDGFCSYCRTTYTVVITRTAGPLGPVDRSNER